VSDTESLPETPLEDESAAKGSKKKKIIIFAVIGVVALLGIGAGLYFTGIIGGGKKDEAAEEGKHAKKGEDAPGFYYDMPDLVVNLSDEDRKQRFLKLSISIEIPSKEDTPKLEAVMPRITDHFQTYLRELRVEDLRGSAGIYRLRQELLARVNSAADPVEVRDVLFREILIQ
jgi:flagellar FliL protein